MTQVVASLSKPFHDYRIGRRMKRVGHRPEHCRSPACVLPSGFPPSRRGSQRPSEGTLIAHVAGHRRPARVRHNSSTNSARRCQIGHPGSTETSGCQRPSLHAERRPADRSRRLWAEYRAGRAASNAVITSIDDADAPFVRTGRARRHDSHPAPDDPRGDRPGRPARRTRRHPPRADRRQDRPVERRPTWTTTPSCSLNARPPR